MFELLAKLRAIKELAREAGPTLRDAADFAERVADTLRDVADWVDSPTVVFATAEDDRLRDECNQAAADLRAAVAHNPAIAGLCGPAIAGVEAKLAA